MGPNNLLCYILLCIIGVSSHNIHEHYICQSDETCAHLFRNPLSKCHEHYCFSQPSAISCEKDDECSFDKFCEEGTCQLLYCKDVYDCPRNNIKNLRASEIYKFIIQCDVNHGMCTKKLKGKKCAASDATGSCCNPGHPGDGKCGEGEGDCDNDMQCLPGLKCGDNNCPKENGMPSNFDCCYRPTAGHHGCVQDTFVCDEDFDKKCMSNIFKCDGDQDCEDGSDETNCAVDGGWTSWGKCGKSCKGGKQKRTCTNPSPSSSGRGCYGRKRKRCNSHIHCAVNGHWAPWASCSMSCNGGEQERMCINPPPSYGGRPCYGKSTQECNSHINCAVDGHWTSWGQCRKSCKGGEQKRTCTNPPPSSSGRGCYGKNTQQCNGNINCPVDGGWASWGLCSQTCEGGKHYRTCTNPPPSSGGSECNGSKTKQCNRNIKFRRWIKGSNVNCWNGCGKKGGSCSSVCGYKGYCCRLNWSDCETEANNLGFRLFHSCVTAVC